MNQVQRTQMNLGTLTQFERSENYVPKYTESQVQMMQTNPRAMDGSGTELLFVVPPLQS